MQIHCYVSIYSVISIVFQGYSNADDFHCSRSEKGGSILSQYEYKRKEKCPRLDVQQNADTEDFDIQDFDIHDFDDSEWPDVEFYADAHQEKGKYRRFYEGKCK